MNVVELVLDRTANEDRASRLDDSELLDRARGLGRVLFIQDDDLLAVTTRQRESMTFGA